MTARWPARVALVAALTAPLIAATATPAEATRRPTVCKTAMSSDRAFPTAQRAHQSRRKVRACIVLRPVVVRWTAVAR